MDFIFQPLYKGQLQRLLLNLCAHNETRTSLVKILMDMLLFDRRKLTDQSNSTELSYRLFACQRNVIYSRPQFFDGENFDFCCCSFNVLFYSYLSISLWCFFLDGLYFLSSNKSFAC